MFLVELIPKKTTDCCLSRRGSKSPAYQRKGLARPTGRSVLRSRCTESTRSLASIAFGFGTEKPNRGALPQSYRAKTSNQCFFDILLSPEHPKANVPPNRSVENATSEPWASLHLAYGLPIQTTRHPDPDSSSRWPLIACGPVGLIEPALCVEGRVFGRGRGELYGPWFRGVVLEVLLAVDPLQEGSTQLNARSVAG